MSKPMTTVSWGVLTVLTACAAPALFQLSAAKAQSSGDSVIYLNQAWSEDDREWYYHFSQGSAVLSYDIFLNLEAADGEELFHSDANLVRYGFLPEPTASGSFWWDSRHRPMWAPIARSR